MTIFASKKLFVGLSATVIFAVLFAAWLFGEEESGPRNTWNAPVSAATVKNPIPSRRESITRGKEIYNKECLACHGSSGRGDGEDAASLARKPSDFTDPSVKKETDGELFWKISNGRKPMPKFGKRLAENERWDLVNYIRSLQSH